MAAARRPPHGGAPDRGRPQPGAVAGQPGSGELSVGPPDVSGPRWGGGAARRRPADPRHDAPHGSVAGPVPARRPSAGRRAEVTLAAAGPVTPRRRGHTHAAPDGSRAPAAPA